MGHNCSKVPYYWKQGALVMYGVNSLHPIKIIYHNRIIYIKTHFDVREYPFITYTDYKDDLHKLV
jgi:hypothetical protein